MNASTFSWLKYEQASYLYLWYMELWCDGTRSREEP